MSKLGYFIVVAIVATEFVAMDFAMANKTTNSFSAFVRITNPAQTDTLGNVIYKP